MTAAAQTFEPHSRPSFRERVLALAGHGTFREPAQPGSVDARRALPADHLVAAALSFGRSGHDDVGPEVAMAMALGKISDAQALRVLRWLGAMLATDRTRSCVRLRPWAGHYAAWALNSVVRGLPMPPAPQGVVDRDHGEVALYACLLLERVAEDALALAARRQRRG